MQRISPWRYYADTRPNRSNAFIVSFSEESDLLSQWRAYCPNGGYSISFPLKHLRTVGESQGFYVARCEYEEEKKRAVIEALIDAALDGYRTRLAATGTAPRPNSPSPDSPEGEVFRLYEQSLAHYGPLLKHHSFKEEKEWRAVLGPLPVPPALYADQELVEPTMKRLRLRAGKGGVVPYCLFEYQTNEIPLTESVIVRAGPSRMNDRGSHVMKAYLKRVFGDKASYSLSQTPYEPL
jgi:hypothetical protein